MDTPVETTNNPDDTNISTIKDAVERLARIEASKQYEELAIQVGLLNPNRNSRRPKGWSRKSIAPYYNEKYALQFKIKVLDELVKPDGSFDFEKEMVFSMDRFPGLKSKSLYMMILQAWNFVIDHLDNPTDKRYWRLKQEMVVRTEKKQVSIRWKFKNFRTRPDLEGTSSKTLEYLSNGGVQAVARIPENEATNPPPPKKKESPKWLNEFFEFVTEAEDGSFFKKEGVNVTENSMASIREAVEGDNLFAIVKLTSDTVIVACSKQFAEMKNPALQLPPRLHKIDAALFEEMIEPFPSE